MSDCILNHYYLFSRRRSLPPKTKRSMSLPTNEVKAVQTQSDLDPFGVPKLAPGYLHLPKFEYQKHQSYISECCVAVETAFQVGNTVETQLSGPPIKQLCIIQTCLISPNFGKLLQVIGKETCCYPVFKLFG